MAHAADGLVVDHDLLRDHAVRLRRLRLEKLRDHVALLVGCQVAAVHVEGEHQLVGIAAARNIVVAAIEPLTFPVENRDASGFRRVEAVAPVEQHVRRTVLRLP